MGRFMVGFACVAWVTTLVIRSTLQASSAGVLPDVLFYVASAASMIGLCLVLLAHASQWMRADDAKWVAKHAKRGRSWFALGSMAALVLSLDLAVAVWTQEPVEQHAHATRIQCSRVSNGAARVTIESDELDGQRCFQALGGSSVVLKRWRVDASLVDEAIEIGGQGLVFNRLHSSLLFGTGAYQSVGWVRDVKPKN